MTGFFKYWINTSFLIRETGMSQALIAAVDVAIPAVMILLLDW
jgi:hypothetical protein